MAIAVGARPIMAPGWSGGVHTDIALVDCDVHQTVHKMDDLIPYMSRVYRQQATEQGIRMAGSGYFNVAIDAGRTGVGFRLPVGPLQGFDPARLVVQRIETEVRLPLGLLVELLPESLDSIGF